MDELKKLLEELGKTHAEFVKTNDERLAVIEANGSAPAELEGKVGKINDELTRLQADIQALTVASTRSASGAGDNASAEQNELRAAMFDMGGFLRSGNESVLKGIQNTVQAGNDPNGGYYLPESTVQEISRVAEASNIIRTLATVTQVGAAAWEEVVTTSGSSAGWTGETASRSEATSPTLASVVITPGEEYAMPAAYQRILDDSMVNIESWLVDETGIAFADLEGAAFATGDGVGKPRGIAGYPWLANASYAWGSVGYVVSGKAGAFADTNPADYLIDLIHGLKTKYRNNAAFLMNDTTLSLIRKFQDGNGNYLWQPSCQMGVPDMMLGKPVYTDDNIADIASNSYSIAFGDFGAAYRIVDRAGVTLLRDPYTSKPKVYFYMTKRVGGGIKNFEALKFMKFSA